MENDFEMENIVRVGVVSAVDAASRKARVMFDDDGMTSGWLFCIQHFAAGIHVEPDNKHAHEGSVPEEPVHNHPKTHLTYWMPSVGERVVVLYIPVFNADGFILGGL